MDELVALVLTAGWMEPDGWFLLEHDKYKELRRSSPLRFFKTVWQNYCHNFTLPGKRRRR